MLLSIRNQRCPNKQCKAYNLAKAGNIRVHSQKEQRVRCNVCKRTWVARCTSYKKLRGQDAEIDKALSQLLQGKSVRAVAKQLHKSPSTIQRWKNRLSLYSPSPLSHA